MTVTCVANTNDVLGEVPRWHAGENALYWIDAFKPAVHRLDPATGAVESWTPPEKLGSFAPSAGGGLIIAGRNGFALYDPRSGKFERIADPENKASKITSKKGVLEGILGYAPEGDVRIDYFKPLADHKVAWNFIQFRGWGGHRMRMQFTWEGTDSVLAAPLVIDIARLALLAQRRGESGHIAALGLFFKTPEGSSEMNLYKQYDALLRWAAGSPATG